MIRLSIVSDIRLYREGLEDMLCREDGIALVGSDSTEEEAIAHARATRPDVLLVDMGIHHHPLALRHLKEVAPEVRIVGLAIPETEEHVIACAEAGVDCYVSRGASLEELIDIVRGATRGEVRCSPRIAGALMKRLATLLSEHKAVPPVTGLTNREYEILKLLEVGMPNKEIARTLTIQLGTVKNHVHSILGKLELASRSEVAAWARARSGTEAQVKTPHGLH